MAENLYSPGQKVLSKEGRENWDGIFDRRVVYDLDYFESGGHERREEGLSEDRKS